MNQHNLDPYPIPKDKAPLFINEPDLIDRSLLEYKINHITPDSEEDNVRIYVPLDLNKKAILRRLNEIMVCHGEATYKNEMEFLLEVRFLLSQVEIYDQIWFGRHTPKDGNHSKEAVELMKEIVTCLEEIPDGGAEMFPFELIDELREEYL